MFLFASLRLSVSNRISCMESDRPAIAAQANRCENKCRRDCEPDPKIRRAQESPRSQLGQRMNVRVRLALKIKSLNRESGQAVPQHSDEMRRVEGNRFEHTDREQR